MGVEGFKGFSFYLRFGLWRCRVFFLWFSRISRLPRLLGFALHQYTSSTATSSNHGQTTATTITKIKHYNSQSPVCNSLVPCTLTCAEKRCGGSSNMYGPASCCFGEAELATRKYDRNTRDSRYCLIHPSTKAHDGFEEGSPWQMRWCTG